MACGINQKFHAEEYVHTWKIPEWMKVQQSEDALKSQTFEFKTGKSTRAQTKWLLGFKLDKSRHFFGIYLKMIEAKGFPNGKVDATVTCTLLYADSIVCWDDTQKSIMQEGQEIEVLRKLGFNANVWNGFLNQKGEISFKFKLVIVEPELPSVDIMLQSFHNTSLMEVQANLMKLLDDKSSADLKIVTKDEKELYAHRAILKVQCPVFESMFRSEFSESKTGIVNVADISAKTMHIFLHYFYSGQLLPSWKDQDTVYEFTYAVGKYQLTNVLKLLDSILGSRDYEDATHVDIQLLDLARKLGLKNAEMELVERIKTTTNKANSGADLFALYGLEK